MNVKINNMVEKRLTITETDFIGGGEALILIAYAVKENDGMWSYPAPQIFNEELYLKNKVNYDNAVKEFRINCDV